MPTTLWLDFSRPGLIALQPIDHVKNNLRGQKLSDEAKKSRIESEERFRKAAKTLAPLTRELQQARCAEDDVLIENVFNEIYDLLAEPIYYYAKNRFELDEASAMTAMHDTLLVLVAGPLNSAFYQFGDDELNEEKAKAQLRWIFGIARKKAIDVFRSERRYGNWLDLSHAHEELTMPTSEQVQEMEAAFEELFSTLHGFQRAVAGVLLEHFPLRLPPRDIEQILHSKGIILRDGSVKRALEEIRRKYDEVLRSDFGVSCR